MKHIALIALMIALMPLGAPAQWLWVDKDGRKVFSDRAPPSSVSESSILKRPGQAKAAPAVANAEVDTGPASTSTAVPGASSPNSASPPKLPRVDKELAEQKKKAEQLEADKRKAEEARVAKEKAENCERAKSAKAGLNAGLRIARINSKGEREEMNEVARAAEVKRVQSIIESDCN